jgi:hypothetical protein
MNVYSLLANGMGGVDWAGLPLVVGFLGIKDMEGLMHRISVIKLHRAPKD